MAIRKRILGLGTAAALLLNMSPASAGLDACYDPCGAWVFGAHALYFTPISCPYAYAQVSLTGGMNIDRRALRWLVLVVQSGRRNSSTRTWM